MDSPRNPLAAPPPPRGSQPSKWALVILTVSAGLAVCAACLLGGIYVLTRYVPGLGGQATSPTAQPVAAASPAATRTPQPAPGATPEPGAGPAGTYFTVGEEWPGPPGDPRTVTLPPAETDPQKLAEAQRLYEQGKAAFDAQQWQQAIASFDDALALDPRHAEAYSYRGAAYRHIGGSYNDLNTYLAYYDRSIADFTRSIVADPSSWDPYNDRGGSYCARGDMEPLREDRRRWYELCVQDYAQASQLDPTQAWPWRNLGQMHVGMGQCDLAIEELQKSQPWTTSTMAIVAAAYRCKGSLSDAMNLMRDAIAADPENPTLYMERSYVYLASGEYAKALEDSNTAAEKWKGQFVPGVIWYDKAAAEYYLGHYDKVEEYILTGRRYTWIDWGQPYYYLGMVYLKQGRTEEGAEALLWAEATLDENDPLLEATRAELEKLR